MPAVFLFSKWTLKNADKLVPDGVLCVSTALQFAPNTLTSYSCHDSKTCEGT